MGNGQKPEIEKDVRFANWNSWYTDLTEEISAVRRLGYIVLFNPKQVNHYYSKIVNLFSTISWAIDEKKAKEIDERLDKIEENIFSKRYLADLKDNNVSEYQRKIIKNLRKIVTQICLELSDAGLLPKVERNIKDKRPAIVRDM